MLVLGKSHGGDKGLGRPWGHRGPRDSCLLRSGLSSVSATLSDLQMNRSQQRQIQPATKVRVTQSTDQVACIMVPEPEWEVSANSSHSGRNPLGAGGGGEGWLDLQKCPAWDSSRSRARAGIQHPAWMEDRAGWGPPAIM